VLPNHRNSNGIDMSLFQCGIQVQSRWHQFRLSVTCIPGSLGNDQMAKVRQRFMATRPWSPSNRHPKVPTFARESSAIPAFCYGQRLFSLPNDDRSPDALLIISVQISRCLSPILVHSSRAGQTRFSCVRLAERYMPSRRLPGLA